MVTSSVRAFDPAAAQPHDALVAAVIDLGKNRALRPMLQQFVETACALTQARYGAMGVLNADGYFDDMFTHGMDAATIQRLGTPPQGRGVLGHIVQHPQTLRLENLASHPSSIGFPEGHPPMSTFLGCPVIIGGEVFGNVYLTEKAHGQTFSEADERVLEALAAAAGSAIAHSRALAQAQARDRWQSAAARAAQIAIEDADGRGWLDALNHVVDMIKADHAELVPSQEAAERLGSLAEEIHDAPGSRVVDDDDVARLLGEEYRVCIAAPIAAEDVSIGVLLLGWQTQPLSLGKTTLAELTDMLADRLTVAALLKHRRSESERVAILEDRDRIAQDLHDRVIQRLFAAGMRVQSVMRQAPAEVDLAKLDDVVTDLDETVTDVRRAIFELHEGNAALGLKTSLATLARTSSEALGFSPSVSLSGDYWTLPDALVTDVLAVVRESLSNIAKHAHATRARIEMHVGEEITLRIKDDGVGIPAEPERRSGIAHLVARAERWSGTCVIRERRSRGTIVDWRVPNRRYA